jgi:hypothetical protein
MRILCIFVWRELMCMWCKWGANCLTHTVGFDAHYPGVWVSRLEELYKVKTAAHADNMATIKRRSADIEEKLQQLEQVRSVCHCVPPDKIHSTHCEKRNNIRYDRTHV